MSNQINTPQFLILGNINGPHVEIIARPGHVEKLSIQNAIEILADPRTTWRSIESLREMLTRDQIKPFRQLKLTKMTGYYGFMEGDPQEDESIPPVSVFFYYPHDLLPEEALKLIEIHQNGIFSPSLAVGLLAIAPYFIDKSNVMQGLGNGFVHIAGSKPAHGISYLSDKSIEARVHQFIDRLGIPGISIEQFFPDAAVDRAKLMLALAEACWKPETRWKIAKAQNNFESLAPLFMIATPWLYLNPGKQIKAAGVNIPFSEDIEFENDPWTQCLEWDAHHIPSNALELMLPDSGKVIEPIALNMSFDYPVHLESIATELARKVLEDCKPKSPPPYQCMRLKLPGMFVLEMRKIFSLRLYGKMDEGCWIGMETPTGTSTSFWWKPLDDMPSFWVTSSMDRHLRAILHLTLACLYHDLTHRGESEFPICNYVHFDDCDLQSWGQENEILLIEKEAPHIAAESGIVFGSAPITEEALSVFNLAKAAFDPTVKIFGRACLALFMNILDPELAGF